jgi:N-acetylglucosaminyldiphosphoundecaprenol N-acetyl-beta-D-mannosaminyltransferase
MVNRGAKNILGIKVCAIDYEFAVATILDSARSGKRCTTSALAVHGIMTGALDRAHKYRLNHLDLITPDGQPVRWALNLLYKAGLRDRVSGPHLTPRVCEAAAREGVSVYFYGSTDPVLERLRANLSKKYPGLQIAGSSPSRFRKLTGEEQEQVAETIRASGAGILFVGLGCPRQEVFAYEMGKYLQMPILAVGAAFDLHAGTLSDTPQILQRMGLQWLHRLIQEPRRLWRRYLVTNTQFVVLLCAQWLRLWKPDLEDTREPVTDARFG